MNLENVKLSLTKYKFKSLQLTIGDKTKHEVPNELIFKMTIVEDYDAYYFPYFQLDIAVPNDIYRKMTKNNQKIKATFQLMKGKFTDALAMPTDTSNSFKNALKGSFYVFMDEATPDLTESEQELVEQSENSYGELTTIRLLLYRYDYYKKYDLVVNTCLEDVTLAEALTYLLTKCGIDDVLLSPPNNYDKYKQFILTPIPASEQIDRICNTYAIHKKGTLVFFGLDALYLIDKQPKCTAYRTNEYKITYIVMSSQSQASKQAGGCYADSSKKYNVVNVMNLSVKNDNEYTSKTVGTDVVSVNSSGKITKTSKKTSTKTKVVVQEDGNATTSALKQSIKESSRVLTVNFADIDFTMMTPNKQFVMTFDKSTYKKYNGKYRLSRITHVFTKEGSYFTVSTNGEFKG